MVTTAIARKNWRPLPGRSPNTFKPLTLDALEIDSGHHEKEVIADNDLSKTEQGWRHGQRPGEPSRPLSAG